VSELVTEHQLNLEQAKRVCEASNLAIKQAQSDPQAVFPVADIKKVISVLQPTDKTKVASVQEEEEEEWLRESLEKVGFTISDELAEALNERMTGPQREIIIEKFATTKKYAVYAFDRGLKIAIKKYEDEMTDLRLGIEKVSFAMLGTLRDELNAKRSINHSFSALVKTAASDEASDEIIKFYKFAFGYLTRDRYKLVEELALTKVAGRVCIANPLFRHMTHYIGLREKLAKKEALYNILHDNRERLRSCSE
jgi:hypothetical protein